MSRSKQLLILIGSSGSGKTYFSSQLRGIDDRWFIISSDNCRLRSTGRVNIFDKPLKHFNSMDLEICKALKKYDYVCYDACSLTKFRRNMLLRRVYKLGIKVEITGIVFRVPCKLCILRDKSELRNHHVGMFVILVSKFLSRFNRPSISEGFDKLITPKMYMKNNYNIDYKLI